MIVAVDFVYNPQQFEYMNLNSEEDQSSIAQENMPTLRDLKPKIITYNDIITLQSKVPTSMSIHENCKPFSISWEESKGESKLIPVPQRLSQRYIAKPVYNCCMDLRLSFEMQMRKNSKMEIFKYEAFGQELQLQESGLRYEIENVGAVVRIRALITSNTKTKIWKEIQIPALSYETESIYRVSLIEKVSGDIYLTVNDFEFMMNFNVAQLKPKFLVFRGEATIKKFSLEQGRFGENEGGCGTPQCIIF